MVLHVLRALFVLLMGAAGYFYIQYNWLTMFLSLTVGVLFVCVDILSPRRKLMVFAGTFFGLLIGVLLAYALSFAVRLIVDQVWMYFPQPVDSGKYVQFVNLLVGMVCCYLSISFILQTKDDFRFIIPYVEFSKQTKGARPILLDTSVLIDGRITDIANTGMIESQLIVPRFVLDELQIIADSADNLKRNRGRRGLDVLTHLRASARADVVLYEGGRRSAPDGTVDQELVNLARQLNARILSNDYNLSKVAQLREVDVININDLANALKPVVLPGERMIIRIVKLGEEPGQGVGYLSDGTMVVVEQARPFMNQDVEFTITRALQTSAGRMIFGRLAEGETAGAVRPTRPRVDPAPANS